MEDPEEGCYYYNHNIVADKKNQIHKASCCECKAGLGKRWYKKRVTKDMWMGPYTTKEQALEKILHLFKKKAVYHDCCVDD